MAAGREAGRARLAAAWAGVAASAAGVAAGITAVYRGMRDLMITNGGVCATGGPFEVRSECGDGQIVLLLGGLALAAVMAALHSAFTAWADGPRLGPFAIGGLLFAALGWNFLDLGLDPPQDDGAAAGWLASGVLFWLLAIGFAIPALLRMVGWLRRGGAPEPPAFDPALLESVLGPRR